MKNIHIYIYQSLKIICDRQTINVLSHEIYDYELILKIQYKEQNIKSRDTSYINTYKKSIFNSIVNIQMIQY